MGFTMASCSNSITLKRVMIPGVSRQLFPASRRRSRTRRSNSNLKRREALFSQNTVDRPQADDLRADLARRPSSTASAYLNRGSA